MRQLGYCHTVAATLLPLLLPQLLPLLALLADFSSIHAASAASFTLLTKGSFTFSKRERWGERERGREREAAWEDFIF